MERSAHARMGVNPLIAAVAFFIATFTVAILLRVGFNEEGIRLVMRTAARTSFVLFVLIFTASPLLTLAPGTSSRWLVANRRSLGLALALSHSAFTLCVLGYMRLYPESFYEVSYPLQRIGGAVGLMVIALMAVTSFDGPRRWVGPRWWKVLHTVGLYYILINFTVSLGRRVILQRDGFYIPFLVLLATAVALRLAAVVKVRQATRGLAS
ncbi:MAG TPA: hypothetical protein VLQ93_06400 [Myxococcaceae bacterium]|nr:hypothetical protein [Myxococcaceae bacterium]